MEEFELEVNIYEIMKKKKISIQTVLDYMGWANRSVLYKKATQKSKVSIEEALKLSKVLKEPIIKIFKLKVAKIDT